MKTWITSIILLLIPFLCGAEEAIYTLNKQWVNCGDGVELMDPYFMQGVTFKWDGPVKNGKAHGKGTATKFIDGELFSTYVGEYKDGIREGKGTVTLFDGSSKTGNFVDGQLIGKGTMKKDNGDVYEGEFINYQMHGNGKLKMGSGATFEGFFVSDIPFTGKYTSYDGSVFFLQDGEEVDKISETKSNYKPKNGVKLTEYFDEDGNRTDAKHAKFYRIITYKEPNLPLGSVKDFYMNGQLLHEAEYAYLNYDDEIKNFREGISTFYYPDGKINSETYYYNNRINGPEISYDENGNKSKIRYYNHGDLIIDSEFYPSGDIKLYARYEDGKLKDNIYYVFDESGTFMLAFYKEDFVENKGNWEYYGPNGLIQAVSEDILYIIATPYRSLSQGISSPFNSDVNGSVNLSILRGSADDDVTIGVLMGFKDWDNYNGLYIKGNQYCYKEVLNGKTVVDKPWTYSPAIQPQLNEISFSNLLGQFDIDINDLTVDSLESPEFPGDLLVVTVINDSDEEKEIAISDLVLCVAIPVDPDADWGVPDLSDENIVGDWTGNGSGFFISEDGLIATNYHVINNSKHIEVSFTRNDIKESYPAKVIFSDEDNDLSIIKIDSPNFTPMDPIPYNFPAKIFDTGTEVFTMGYPILGAMGDEVKFTDGKISSRSGFKGDKRTYQVTAPVQPGNSGGPLFDMKGNLIGVNAAILPHAQNVTYSIKIPYLKELVDKLPGNIKLMDSADCSSLSLVDMIKKFTPYVTLIKIK